MIFFTRKLSDRLQSDYQKTRREWKRWWQIYANYQAAIAPLLPTSVKRLCRASLHDAEVVKAHQKAGDLTLVLDTSNALSRFRGYCVHLCFHGVKKHVPIRGLVGQWWINEEAHLCSRSRFSLHVRFDRIDLEIDADELEIEQFKRQLINRVGPQEFRRFPIWEFTRGKKGIDDREKTWIRPMKRAFIPRNAHSMIVATEFTTQSRRTIRGFLVVSTANGGVKIESGGAYWRGFRKFRFVSRKKNANQGLYCSIKDRNDLVRALDQKETEVFPINYRFNAAILGVKGLREGIIM